MPKDGKLKLVEKKPAEKKPEEKTEKKELVKKERKPRAKKEEGNKPKRVMTEAQKEALKKGQAALKERREKKKE